MEAEPHSVAQAFHRRCFANIHVEILRRRERHRAPIGSQKLCKFKLVAIFLVETKEADGRREQFVEGDLDIGNHMQGNCRTTVMSELGAVPVKYQARVS